MHAMHIILVNLEKINITKEYLQNNRKEAIDCIRDYAEIQTEDFRNIVFEGRRTNNIGGWSYDYPENVLLGSENPELLLEEIENCQGMQMEEINANLEFIREKAGDSLSSIREYASKEPVESLDVLWLLKITAQLLSGSYCFDSLFYDLEKETARIDSNTIEKVKQSPENWALVLFDYHN